MKSSVLYKNDSVFSRLKTQQLTAIVIYAKQHLCFIKIHAARLYQTDEALHLLNQFRRVGVSPRKTVFNTRILSVPTLGGLKKRLLQSNDAHASCYTQPSWPVLIQHESAFYCEKAFCKPHSLSILNCRFALSKNERRCV